LAKITAQNLLDAGVHFGHQTKRWNPKMKPFIFGARNGIHIFDLSKTMHKLNEACQFLHEVVSDGGDVLFVGTKRQAQEVIKNAAEKSKMHFIAHRWLGGSLTNLTTIRKSVAKLNDYKKMDEDGTLDRMKKKTASKYRREMAKLDRILCGIVNLEKPPACMVIVDIIKEHIAVREAISLKIPIIAIVDSNCNPDSVQIPIPANDDAVRSVKVIVDQMSDTIFNAKSIADKIAAQKAEEEAKKKAAEDAERAAREKIAREEAEKKAAEYKKESAKKASAKTAPKKDSAKKAEVKTEAKKPVTKKAEAKTEAKKPMAKKAEAKTEAKKPEAKKAEAKTEAKKPEAKKAEAKTETKKPEAKKAEDKTEAKKPVAKKAEDKTEAKKPVAKKAEVKKPAAKKAAPKAEAKKEDSKAD